MPPRPSVDDRLLRLREIRDGGDLVQIRQAASKALTDPMNLVVAEAAKLIGQFELSGMEPELIAVWDRLLMHPDPIKVDKNCWAKAAIIEALGQLNFDDPDLYLSAIAYHQMEPAWQKEVDTADNVRAGAAFGLARSQRIRIVDKLVAFVGLLPNLSPDGRADRFTAIKAIADTGSEAAVPLLRLKLLSGDPEAEVLGLCMAGLLSIAPEPSIPFVAGYLKHPIEDAVLEAAAALGVCGRPAAVEALIAACRKSSNAEVRKSLLLSIGISRNPVAIDFLISQLEMGENVEEVLEALRPACVYQETQRRVREVLKARSETKVLADFDAKFGRDDFDRPR